MALALALCCTGCEIFTPPASRNLALERVVPPADHIPNGEFKVGMPPYVIEPPDQLLIDAVKVVPKPPYRIETLDVIQIRAQGVFPEHPIDGNYLVEAGGTINLGAPYGSFKVAGLSVDEVTDKIQKELEKTFSTPTVFVALAQTSGQQQISGSHQVTPEGKVNMGTYGEVYVAGMTLDEARKAIEKHLQSYLEDPQVTVDVASYNSKVYYVITDGAGLGDRIVRLPIVGGDTVMDAISIVGLSPSSDDIYIVRPSPDRLGLEQRLPVRWKQIVKEGNQATNYQLMPGDQLVLNSERSTVFDNAVNKITAPIQEISGTILLGLGSVRSLSTSVHNNNNNP